MAAMLVVPAAGLVQAQPDGRQASRRAPARSATGVAVSGVMARAAISRSNAAVVRVDSGRRDQSQIASPKLRFVAKFCNFRENCESGGRLT
jgi:hypothetical protein